MLCLDEFALQSTPNSGHAWAEKNTSPVVPSDERHRQRINGFLSVDLMSGATQADFRPRSKTEDAVFVIASLVLRYARWGYRHLLLVLDNCRIHGEGMKAALAELLAEIADTRGIVVEFLHTPRYSPNFNPAEYLIHWVRQNALYHLPVTFTLQDKAARIQSHLAQGPPFGPEPMRNLLRHIYRLPKNGWS